VFDAAEAALWPWLVATVASGAVLLLLEVYPSAHWLHHNAALAVYTKLVLIALVPWAWDQRVALLLIAVVLASVRARPETGASLLRPPAARHVRVTPHVAHGWLRSPVRRALVGYDRTNDARARFSMHPTFRFVTPLLLFAVLFTAWAAAGDVTPTQREEALRRHGVIPSSALESRVGNAPAYVLKMFDEPGVPAPTAHSLTQDEQRKLAAAFAALPPLHRRVLGERLRRVSFLDGMENTALTSTVNADEPYRLFDITIRAGILSESVSEWLTWKERTCYDGAGSSLSVSVEAGTMDALLYVLLHEATHIVDISLGFTPPFRQPPAAPPEATAFTEGIWADRTTASEAYREPALQRLVYRAGGGPRPIAEAPLVYAALLRTPFASLYGSTSWYDDLAEFVSLYHLSEKLGQPFRIVVRDGTREVAAFEPMRSDLVRRRFAHMRRFYE